MIIVDAALDDFPPGTRVMLVMRDSRPSRYVVDLVQVHPFFIVGVFWGEWEWIGASRVSGVENGVPYDRHVPGRNELREFAAVDMHTVIKRGQTICWPIAGIKHITTPPPEALDAEGLKS